MSAYRSASAGGSLEGRLARIAELEARVTPAFWGAFAIDTEGRLDVLRAEAGDEGRSDRSVAMDAYAELLEACIERAPEVEYARRELREGCPPAPADHEPAELEGWGAKRALAKAFGDAPMRITRPPRPKSWFKPWIPRTLIELESADPPLTITRTFAEGGNVEERFTVSAYVPAAAPALEVGPRGFFHALAIWFRSRPLGKGPFGARFDLREGATEAAEALLTNGVRKALLRLARHDVPWLSVGGGVASVTFSFGWDPRPLRDAAEALRELRAIRVREPLLVLR